MVNIKTTLYRSKMNWTSFKSNNIILQFLINILSLVVILQSFMYLDDSVPQIN